MYKITLVPDVVRFLQEHATITDHGNFKDFKLPNWTLRHLELNDFEVITIPERYFYVSYNAVNPEDDKTVIGHIAFSYQGFPSLVFITEVLIPDRSTVKCTDVVMLAFQEFKSRADFDDFTIGRGMNDQLDTLGLN